MMENKETRCPAAQRLQRLRTQHRTQEADNESRNTKEQRSTTEIDWNQGLTQNRRGKQAATQAQTELTLSRTTILNSTKQ
jgi:hypothetical protein